VLGAYLQRRGFFRVLEAAIRIRQKVLKYTPAQKLQMLFVALLAGAKAVSHTGLTLRVDRALQIACGLPGCAEQLVIADTLDAATAQDMADLRQAVETLFVQYSQARQHPFEREVLTLDLDLSPLPASPGGGKLRARVPGPQPLENRPQAGAGTGGGVPGDGLGRGAARPHGGDARGSATGARSRRALA
jgi:hypothetical protein